MAENKKILGNCCFFVSLRTGSLLIALFSLLFSMIGAAYSLYLGLIGNLEGWPDLIIDIVHLVLASILIHGVRSENVQLVNIWVWVTSILVGITIILGILIIILTDSLIGAIILLVVSVLQIYFVLVVRSYAVSISSLLPTPV
ncbi:uncharacterized protein LOC121854229 [Homarus americanus]|uniref:Uncharacterized protein n=1 Tax=Homarus americanus TaxID=6706 RepID=A0A8J5JKE0_HOMAM|nr:uncharacterized protein LOC121854229 [Homarus americanus]KAG7156028.1 hypothetical protein Hamer_G022935 [Homarus americanus]